MRDESFLNGVSVLEMDDDLGLMAGSSLEFRNFAIHNMDSATNGVFVLLQEFLELASQVGVSICVQGNLVGKASGLSG